MVIFDTINAVIFAIVFVRLAPFLFLLKFVAVAYKWSHANRMHMSAPMMADSDTIIPHDLSVGVQAAVVAPLPTTAAPAEVEGYICWGRSIEDQMKISLLYLLKVDCIY
jgi:hypothetical protein